MSKVAKKSSAPDLGSMNKRIKLMGREETFGLGGRPVVTSPVIASVWAAVSSRYHAPLVRGQGVDFPTTINFITHYHASYEGTKQVEWDNRLFDVLSRVDPDGDNRFMEFKTRETNL